MRRQRYQANGPDNEQKSDAQSTRPFGMNGHFWPIKYYGVCLQI